MSWTEARDTWARRQHTAAHALGILGIFAGAVLLRRPVPLWAALGTLADGALRLVSGRGVIDSAVAAFAGPEGPDTPGHEPAMNPEV